MSVRTHGSVKKAGGTHVTVRSVCVCEWGGMMHAASHLLRDAACVLRNAQPRHYTVAGQRPVRYKAGTQLARF